MQRKFLTFLMGLLLALPLAGCNDSNAQDEVTPPQNGEVTPPPPSEDAGDFVRRNVGLYTEEFRPQYHYNPPFGWMNDPNGPVFYQGEYHLFYQYNPFATSFGSIGWGHTISEDLVHWQPLPVAIPPREDTLIFSGSVVIDAQNTSGLCESSDPGDPSCLVAIYTAHRILPTGINQTQDLAYSNDRGRTWTKFEGNPVLDLNLPDFRDPRVFWHEPTQRWIMAIVLPIDRQVLFYGSPDLISWESLSTFGPTGATEGIWECPDLMEVPVIGDSEETRWLLKIDHNPGHITGGSGGQYFIGNFDGEAFIPEEPEGEEILWVDYGKDFYCSQHYAAAPGTLENPTWIAWMNNWEYAGDIPTYPWRGSMTFPRTLRLEQTPEGLRLFQAPVDSLASLRGPVQEFQAATAEELDSQLSGANLFLDRFEMVLTIRPGEAQEVGMQLFPAAPDEGETAPAAVIGYNTERGDMFVDRPDAGNAPVNDTFPGLHNAPLPMVDNEIRLHLLVDRNSVELFGNEGRRVITDLFFPQGGATALQFYSVGPVESIEVSYWPLRSVW